MQILSKLKKKLLCKRRLSKCKTLIRKCHNNKEIIIIISINHRILIIKILKVFFKIKKVINNCIKKNSTIDELYINKIFVSL